MFVLALLSIVTAPLTIDIFLSARKTIRFAVLTVVKTLALFQLVPLLVALGFTWLCPEQGRRLIRPSLLTANVLLVLVVLLLGVRDNLSLIELPISTVIGIIALTIIMFAAGWLLGGPAGAIRRS